MSKRYLAWYDNQSDPTGRPCWEGGDFYEADTPQEAAAMAKADGCQWTDVCVTLPHVKHASEVNILARA
jgi:hypothetical protein